MTKNLVFVQNASDYKINSVHDKLDTKIFSFSVEAHRFLEKNKIKHELSDTYLNELERTKLFDFVVASYNWFNENSIKADFDFGGINLLDSLDTIEFHSYVLSETINFLTIKKIIEQENPSKIITSRNFSKTVNHLIKEKNISLEIYGKNFKRNLHWDKITIKYNIGKFPVSFHVSRNFYIKTKTIVEQIICSLFGLWFNLKNNMKKTILLLEFNPSEYTEFFSQLSNYDQNVILINRRRPAIWNRMSINTLRKNNCKLINFKSFLQAKEKKQILKIVDNFTVNLEKLYERKHIEKFSLGNDNIWPIIKDVIIDTYKKRMLEYIPFIMAMKNLFKIIKLSCIVSLNQVGETEKTILNINKNQIPFILLEHAFANYTHEISRYSILNGYPSIRDKIAVWGNIQKKYLVDHHGVDSNKIIVTGSPKHDSFFNQKLMQTEKSKKTILIAPHAITEITGQSNTELYIKFENIIQKICLILKKIPDVRIIVKLHPGQPKHNEDLKMLFSKIDSSIPIYLLTSTRKLIEASDVVLTISPEGMDPSTIILESLILNKPTMNIILDNHFYEFEYVKDNAIISVSDKEDLEKKLCDLLFDDIKKNILISNGKKFLKNYLSNHGTASENLAKVLNSF